jgi:hypothetical protein
VSSPRPSVGRIVHYQLTEQDVQLIDQLGHPDRTGRPSRNPVRAGQTYPAMVVAVFDPTTGSANLKVFLDGGAGAEYWATSRGEGDEPGQWSWPPRV